MLECFEAQSLHLRYGPATPFLWLQPVRCLPVCTFGNRVLARLSLCRTLTDCISHAFLGALIDLLIGCVREVIADCVCAQSALFVVGALIYNTTSCVLSTIGEFVML